MRQPTRRIAGLVVATIVAAGLAAFPGVASAGSVVYYSTEVTTATGYSCTLSIAGSVNLTEWNARPLPWGQVIRWSSGADCSSTATVSYVRSDSNVWIEVPATNGLVWWEGTDVSCSDYYQCEALGHYDDAWRGPMDYHVVARYQIRAADGWAAFPRGSYHDGFACEVDSADARYLLCYAEAYGDY